MTYDNPLITYDGAPTDAFFAQLLAKVVAVPGDTVAALQATTIPVDVQTIDSDALIGPTIAKQLITFK